MREQREMCEWVSGEKNQCVLCVVIDTDDVMAVFTISHIPSSTARISSSTATVAVVLPGFRTGGCLYRHLLRLFYCYDCQNVALWARRNEGNGDRVGESL